MKRYIFIFNINADLSYIYILEIKTTDDDELSDRRKPLYLLEINYVYAEFS